MKKLKLDGRTEAERMMEELKISAKSGFGQEEEKKSHYMVLDIQSDGADGIEQRPQVQLVIDTRKNF